MQEPSWEASGVRSGERKEETERWSWKLGRTVCLRAQEEKKNKKCFAAAISFLFFLFLYPFVVLV